MALWIDPAEATYDEIRRSTTDVAKIAESTGYKRSNIAKVKRHLFVDLHLLDRYVAQGLSPRHARFDPDETIAAAWRRLEKGAFTPADKQLLRHEIAEAWYMRHVAKSYDRAHNAAQRRFPAPELVR